MTSAVVIAASWKSQQPGTRSFERHRLALLVDAENQVRSTAIPELIRRLETEHFDLAIRRCFADWANPGVRHWRHRWNALGIWCIDCPPSAEGKSSTDARLIETALDLADHHVVNAVCIVSADADFAPVMRYLRRCGLVTIVASTGGPDISEVLRDSADRVIKIGPEVPFELLVTSPGIGASEMRWERLFEAAIERALDTNPEADGWVDLGVLGNKVREIYASFDHRQHGHEKLLDLVRTRPNLFELETRPGRNNTFSYQIRRSMSASAKLEPVLSASQQEATANG